MTWFPPSHKKPPPAHGIKIKKAGTTWWGQRWIAALEHVLRGDSGRLARGRTYARAGRTHDLTVEAGQVSAKVTGSRATPYDITLKLRQLSDADWQRAIAGMVEKAQFSAELLAGEMPKDIDDVFRAAELSLFPRQRAELVTTCSCPDWGDPCKHVAAAHYVLGEALDRDPFLLFELRGRTKAQVLEALRVARSAADTTDSQSGSDVRAPGPDEPENAGYVLPTLSAHDYDAPRAALPDLQFSFATPSAPAAALRQLGAPTAWQGAATPVETLGPLLSAAAEAARRIALEEGAAAQLVGASPSTQAASSPTPTGKTKALKARKSRAKRR